MKQEHHFYNSISMHNVLVLSIFSEPYVSVMAFAEKKRATSALSTMYNVILYAQDVQIISKLYFLDKTCTHSTEMHTMLLNKRKKCILVGNKIT